MRSPMITVGSSGLIVTSTFRPPILVSMTCKPFVVRGETFSDRFLDQEAVLHGIVGVDDKLLDTGDVGSATDTRHDCRKGSCFLFAHQFTMEEGPNDALVDERLA